MSALEVRRLKAFGQQVYGDADRDLRLLRAIETTLDALDVEHERATQLNAACGYFLDAVKKAERKLDETGTILSIFEKARDAVGRTHEQLVTRHRAAVNDPELREEDGIVDAYAALIEVTAELHNNLNKLAWLIGENEADHDKIVEGGPYTSSEDLFAALGV